MRYDPDLRRLKANAAHRMRAEAADLHMQAWTLENQAAIIEQTWALREQTGSEPDFAVLSAQTGRWESPAGT